MSEDPAPATSAKPWKKRLYLVPVWAGMGVRAWAGALIRHRFAIHWTRLPMVLLISLMAPLNSALGLVQGALLRLRPRHRPLADPIFVLGHWRSGTTLLHELLALDQRFTAPFGYACFASTHFLVSRRLLAPLVQLLTPRRRPQDEMSLGVMRPQEDEFALIARGLPSPYSYLMFPRRASPDARYLDFEGVAPADVARWREALLAFLRALAWRDPRPPILKSPAHTARVPVLVEMFPRARFIHIARDPRIVIPSTQLTVRAMADAFGLHYPDPAEVEELAFDWHERVHRRLEEARPQLDPSRFVELCYEDLAGDPVGVMRRIYDSLALGGFAAVQPRIERYFADNAAYRPRRHQISPAEERRIEERCSDMMRRYGYARTAAAAHQGGKRTGAAMVFAPCQTERLLLRRFELEDAPEVQRLAGDPDVALRTGNIPYPYPDGAAAAWIKRGHTLFAAGTLVPVAIVQRGDNALVGCLSFLKKEAQDPEAELAYWLGKPWWGRGYVVEAVRACLAPGALPIQLTAIWAGVLPENRQSIRVIEKLGMRRDGSYSVERPARSAEPIRLQRYRLPL